METRNPAAYRDALEYALGVPFVDGNRLTPLINGDRIFPAMLQAIGDAQHRIEFVTFVYWSGEIAQRFAEALANAARRGVQVRVLLDAYGCRSMEDENVRRLTSSEVEVRWFRPLGTFRLWRVDKRTHRKILVVDDRVAFTGGVGIADEWGGDARNSSEWRETHLQLEGPAVFGLRAAFLDNWNEAGEWTWDSPIDRCAEHDDNRPVQVIRSDSTVGWTDMAAVIRALMAIAQARIRIVTAYFVPDEPTLKQMLATMERGVSLELLLPGQYTDSRLSQLAGNASVECLLRAGAQVWQYEKTMLHAKVIIVDDLVCCIGSPNFNHRSLGKDEECCVVMLSDALAEALNGDFDADCRDATVLQYQSWSRRGRLLRLCERAARLVVEQL